MNKRILLFIFMLGSAVFFSSTVSAANNIGTITHYHLNASFDGRGACISMNPALPGTGWACLWRGNNLYPETTDLLLKAYSAGKTCNVLWDTLDANGHALIRLVDCQ